MLNCRKTRNNRYKEEKSALISSQRRNHCWYGILHVGFLLCLFFFLFMKLRFKYFITWYLYLILLLKTEKWFWCCWKRLLEPHFKIAIRANLWDAFILFYFFLNFGNTLLLAQFSVIQLQHPLLSELVLDVILCF